MSCLERPSPSPASRVPFLEEKEFRSEVLPRERESPSSSPASRGPRLSNGIRYDTKSYTERCAAVYKYYCSLVVYNLFTLCSVLVAGMEETEWQTTGTDIDSCANPLWI